MRGTGSNNKSRGQPPISCSCPHSVYDGLSGNGGKKFREDSTKASPFGSVGKLHLHDYYTSTNQGSRILPEKLTGLSDNIDRITRKVSKICAPYFFLLACVLYSQWPQLHICGLHFCYVHTRRRRCLRSLSHKIHKAKSENLLARLPLSENHPLKFCQEASKHCSSAASTAK